MVSEISSVSGVARPADLPIRKALVVGLGNALEFYDFLVFSFFAIQIGRTFFPESQTSHGLLFTLATFGVGFVTRPLGGILIGAYADRAGRKPAMMLSFSLMGASILGLALTPSFDQIGMAAPVMLLVFRLVQGFALGGEVGPSTAFLVEAAPPGRRGYYTSVQMASQGAAILVAGLVGFTLAAILPPQDLDSWGWRVALLLGVAVVPVGLYVRRKLPETLHQAPQSTEVDPTSRRVPLILIVLSLLMLGAMTTTTYTLTYLNTYAQDTLKLVTRIAFGATIVQGFCYLVAAPIAGMLSDRFGPRPVMLVAVAGLLLMVVPGFTALANAPSIGTLLLVTFGLSALGQTAAVTVMLAIVEALPKAVRAAAVGTIYAVAIALFGGTAQFIAKWLIDSTGNPLAPAWYLSGFLVVGALAMIGFTRPRPRPIG